ncbi:MAG: SMR family transporter [Thiohalorhabdaceae bacterium]
MERTEIGVAYVIWAGRGIARIALIGGVVFQGNRYRSQAG